MKNFYLISLKSVFMGLMVFGLILSIGFTVDAQTPDEESVCDGLEGAVYGLCNAYCEAMDCDSLEPQASETACDKVLANFMQKTDGLYPPCVCPSYCTACTEIGVCSCACSQ